MRRICPNTSIVLRSAPYNNDQIHDDKNIYVSSIYFYRTRWSGYVLYVFIWILSRFCSHTSHMYWSDHVMPHFIILHLWLSLIILIMVILQMRSAKCFEIMRCCLQLISLIRFRSRFFQPPGGATNDTRRHVLALVTCYI